MKILGLVDIHPFSDTDAFTCMRVENNGDIFDVPLQEHQIDILIANYKKTPKETVRANFTTQQPLPPVQLTPEDYTPVQFYDDDDTPLLVEDPRDFSMGGPLDVGDEDDRL